MVENWNMFSAHTAAGHQLNFWIRKLYAQRIFLLHTTKLHELSITTTTPPASRSYGRSHTELNRLHPTPIEALKVQTHGLGVLEDEIETLRKQ